MSDKLEANANSNKVNPHPGLGLFASDAAKEGARRAFEVASRLSSKPIGDEEQKQLLLIARHHEADKRHEKEITFSQVRQECRDLTRKINKVAIALAKLSPETIAFIHGGHAASRYEPQELRNFQSGMTKLQTAAERSIPKQSKVASLHLRQAVEKIIKLREIIEGRKFKYSWEEQPKVIGSPDKFIADDANFVLQVLNAIDENVRFSHIRSIGKNWSKPGAKKK